ncbi:glycosyltransferase family 4 protein [Mesoterricola sediminis]|uniref:Glycosyltransferase subfamily 4-like N-terminal domain-containing protein n=1 Tax=Mesoterricola sediminis TaxID=2927980 RepID=A0AA48KCC4_9BACT|nr:glycosyltransferase family 4 protein [Mesoterricola sediminis]BDU75920.1 hypothetical protein METESE_08780 [Mesoterricola sediminis]
MKPRIRRLAYLCMQATREGQASYAHVNEIIAGLRRRGVTVDLFEPPRREGSQGLAGRAWGFLTVQLRLVARLADYDAVYLRGHFVAALAIWAAKVLRIPLVIEVNGPHEDVYTMYPWTRRFGGFLRALTRHQHRIADAIVTVTPQMAQWVKDDCGAENVHVVPNGANLDHFRPGLRDARAPGGPYAVFFGAFSPWQGIATMLAAVRHPDWPAGMKLVLAGDGTERPAVEAAAREDGRVVYAGVLPYRELGGLVAPATVGLCVKDDGGTHAATGWSPLKLYEMMATGIPVVVTDLPGQFEVVEAARAGLVLPPGDPGALARAVAHLAAHPDEARAMGARGHELVAREHSWDRRGQDTLEVLEGVARGASRA